jgi:hydroxymethylpyrimidine/phosphomethylpyrimidine kinase
VELEGTRRPEGATPRALSIAGSDSGGGAGIQADLKAFAHCGVHGMCAITALTAQSTVGVSAIDLVAPEMVLAQIRAVAGDIGLDAVKVGMIASAEIALAVAEGIEELPAGTPVVVDPVMVAESGARLLDDAALQTLVEEILPRAAVLTPNLPEARVLAGWDPRPAGAGEESDEELLELARAVLALGPRAVLITGGHRAMASDLLLDPATGAEPVMVGGPRHPDGASHGSGCTHSAVLAAQLALGRDTLQAARTAREMAGEAVAQGLRDIGAGAGPVDIAGLARIRRGREDASARLP